MITPQQSRVQVGQEAGCTAVAAAGTHPGARTVASGARSWMMGR